MSPLVIALLAYNLGAFCYAACLSFVNGKNNRQLLDALTMVRVIIWPAHLVYAIFLAVYFALMAVPYFLGKMGAKNEDS